MSLYKSNARLLAVSIDGCIWDEASLVAGLSRALQYGPPDPRHLAARLLSRFPAAQSPPSRFQLAAFFQHDEALRQAWQTASGVAGIRLSLDPNRMQPESAGWLGASLPPLPDARALSAWLGVSLRELAWFADQQGLQGRILEPRLHHYRYHWLAKAAGGRRLLEIPKARLKAIQRQILRELLNRVEPHVCTHGFRRGRSNLSFVAPHVGKAVVLRIDLKDFFHSVPVARVGALFRRLGYPAGVAAALRGLCTHRVAPGLIGRGLEALPHVQRSRLVHEHLPQGAPTSPALSNLCAWRLDARLSGVARRFALDYTRYADDLAFSGAPGLARLAPFLEALVGAIAREEGFAVNHRKTRLGTQAQRQQLAGIVVNRRPNLARSDFDRLKATLHNCARFGPDGQNRDGISDFRSHLAGRVAYAACVNADKGERLRRLFARIEWPPS